MASRVSRGEVGRGILVCGTGMGMAIIANKFPGVYAAVCENRTAAERARSINNSNVLTLGGFVTPPEEAKEIVEAWLMTEFPPDGIRLSRSSCTTPWETSSLSSNPIWACPAEGV